MMCRAAAVAALLALTACQDGAPAFETMSVDLPEDSGGFPDGPGVEAIVANCTACHSPDMILNQPALTRDQWRGTIAKMREVHRASIDPAAEEAMLDYLEARSARMRQEPAPHGLPGRAATAKGTTLPAVP